MGEHGNTLGNTLGNVFGRGVQGQQNQGQQQIGAQGQGGAGGGDVKYEKRTNPNEVKEVGKKAIEELKKTDEKFSQAVDKISQSFSQSLSSLKASPDDPALMKQLGEDLAKRKEASEKEPTVGGTIIDDIVKATKERSDLAVEQVKQTALQLQPPPAPPAQPPAPKVTVADRIKAFASQSGSSSSKLSGDPLAAASAAGNAKAEIPALPGRGAFGSGGTGMSERTPTSTPERIEAGRGSLSTTSPTNVDSTTGSATPVGVSLQMAAPPVLSNSTLVMPPSSVSALPAAPTLREAGSRNSDTIGNEDDGRRLLNRTRVVAPDTVSELRSIANLLQAGENQTDPNPVISVNEDRNAKRERVERRELSVRRVRDSRNTLLQKVKEKMGSGEVPVQRSILIPSAVVSVPSSP